MKKCIIIFLLGVFAAGSHGDTLFLRDGQELVFDSHFSAIAGTMDYANHVSGFAYRMKTRVQVSGRTLNIKFSNIRFTQFVGAPENAGDPFAGTSYINVGNEPPAFAIRLNENGLFKEIVIPSNTNTFQRNIMKGWASTLQINADKIKAGQRSFRSREQQLHGDCDVTYTVSKQAVRKTVSHTEDCENRVYRIVDDWRSFRCDGKTTNEGSGYPSSFTSTAFQVSRDNDRWQIDAIVATSSFVAQYFTEEGATHTVFTNITSVVVDRKQSSGDISVSGDTVTDIKFEWADANYKWDVDRNLKDKEPLFATGEYFDDSQGSLKDALKRAINAQKDIIHNLDKDDASLEKAHRYGINSIFPAFYALDYDSLKSLADEIFADTSDTGITRANVFGELLGAAGTTASALVVRDLLLEGKFDNSRDAARILTSVPYHIRRPNKQLVKEFESLLEEDTERFVKLSVPLVLGHLIRMTCKRAGPPGSEESIKCWTTFASSYVEKYMDRYNREDDRKVKGLILAGLANIRYGGQSKVLRDIITGKTGEDDQLRSLALRAAAFEAILLGAKNGDGGASYFLPIFLERTNNVELRIAALEMITWSKPTTAQLGIVVTALYSEPNYEVVNYAVALFERIAGSLDPCKQDTAKLVRFYLRFMKQFTGYEVDYGFGVSKTYTRSFYKKKYGYGAHTTFYVVGSDKSFAPISLGMFFGTTMMNTYKNFAFGVHLRVEGLAKHLIRKFKTTDPGTWKTQDLQRILSGEMGIRARPDQPVRVQITISIKGNIVLHRLYDDESARPDGQLKGLLSKLREAGGSFSINHQRAIQLGALLYEQPTGLGVPLAAMSSMTWVISIKATQKGGESRGLLFRDIEYHAHSFAQAMRGVMIRLPFRKAAYGILNDRIYHVHVPRRLIAGINPFKRELKLSISRPPYEDPFRVFMHSRTQVIVRGNTLKGDYDSLQDNCPSCKQRTLVSRGPSAVADRVILEHDNTKAGYFVFAEYFKCEMDIRKKNTIPRALAAFAPFNKNPKTPYNSISMGLQQIRMFLFLFPKNEQCGAQFRWSQSSQNPVNQIEISIRGSGEKNGEMLFFRGRKIFAKVLIKAKGEPADRSYRINFAYEFTPGNIQNKIKLQINRAEVPALNIQPYSVCLALENKYPDLTPEFLDYDPNTNLIVNGKAMIQYGAAKTCSQGDGEIKVNFEHSTTEEAREKLKDKWYYKKCQAAWNRPEWKNRKTFPVTEECFMTLYDATLARKYTWDISLVKVSDRLKRIAERVRSLVRAGFLPYWDIDPDADSADEIGPFLNLDLTFKNDETSVDIKTETRRGVEEYEDVPLRLDWTKSLRNLKFTKLLRRLYYAKIINPCVLTSQSVRTNDNVTYAYSPSTCWTLASSKCSPTPEYAVFTKKVAGSRPLAARIFLGGHEVEMTPSGSSTSVTVNGKPISVGDKDQYEHEVDGVEIFRIFRWGSSYHVYSFLRVWASYDGHFVEVVPAPSARGQHCGICGNYNRVQSDELIGKDLQKLSSPEQLVKDWEWKC